MEQLINALPAVLKAAADSSEVQTAVVHAAWRHVTGELLRSHAIPNAFAGGELLVLVDDAIWEHQLRDMRKPMRSRLNQLLGSELVRSIRFRVDPEGLKLHRAHAVLEQHGAAGAAGDPAAELSEAARAIPDPDLRRAFLEAAGAMLRRQEADAGQ